MQSVWQLANLIIMPVLYQSALYEIKETGRGISDIPRHWSVHKQDLRYSAIMV